MKRFVQLALIAAVAAGSAESADAGSRYYEVYAKPIYRKSVFMLSGGWKFFQTYNLGPATQFGTCYSPNTFMVVTRPDGTTAYNDNCFAGTKRSCKNVYGTAGLWKVTVFATQAQNCGSMDVRVGSTVLNTGVDFGGTIINLHSQLPNGQSFAFDTVHQPDGADDTVMIHYGSTWQEKAYSDDDGIGYASRFISEKQAGDRIVVGSWSYVNAGNASVVINDCLNVPDNAGKWNSCFLEGKDADKDNLSDFLELDILTNGASHDTDDDGIYDYFEVIGRTLDGVELELVSIGANPRRRDVFIERDSQDEAGPGASGMTQPEDDIQTAQSYYWHDWDLPSVPQNVDGTSGIWLHVDTGDACSVSTLCGDWGGYDVHSYGGGSAISYATIKSVPLMEPVRWGIFHYGYLTEGGTGRGSVPGASFWSVGDDPHHNQGEILAHELGHNLGLSHFGHWGDVENGAPGSIGMNHKPTYPSLMNYAYSYIGYGFSDGSRAPLNYLNLDELSYSAGADTSYLADEPFSYKMFGSNQIDWNRDGRQAPDGVRFDIGPQESSASGNWPLQIGAGEVDPEVPLGGPGLVEVAGTLYAFAVFSNSVLRYSKTAQTEGGWSSWQGLNPSWVPYSSGETAAGVINTAQGVRILVLHPNVLNHALSYLLFDPATDTIVESGAVPGWPVGTTARQATITPFLTAAKLAVVYRNQSTAQQVWYATFDDTGAWSAWSQLSYTGGASLPSWTTPGLVHAADGNEYVALIQPSFIPNEDAVMHIGSRPAGTAGDFALIATAAVEPAGVSITSVSEEERVRVNLITLPFQKANGFPFDDASAYLAALYNFQEGNNWIRAYTGGYVAPSGSSFPADQRPAWYSQARTRGAWHTHSIAAVNRAGNATVVYTGTDNDGTTPLGMWHVPYAHNIAPSGFTAWNIDWNDRAVMLQTTPEHMMCSVWNLTCSERCTNPDPGIEYLQCSPVVEELTEPCPESFAP